MNSLHILLGLLGATSAIPTTSTSACTHYTDTYDDLAANAASPALDPISIYHGLLYKNWDVKEVNSASDFSAHSPSNVIVSTAINDVVDGDISFTPFGTISTSSGTRVFDLKSFYLACNIFDAQSLVGAAESCTISVVGYYANGQQAPVQTFTFANTAPGANVMSLAVLPSTYTGLSNVTLGIAGAGTNVATAAVDIDSLVHCNYT